MLRESGLLLRKLRRSLLIVHLFKNSREDHVESGMLSWVMLQRFYPLAYSTISALCIHSTNALNTASDASL